MKSCTFTMRTAVSFGAGDEVIMSIAGHVSGAMLSRYSHVRMEAKRRAPDEIAARQCAADEKRQMEAERREHPTLASFLALKGSTLAARDTLGNREPITEIQAE